MRKTCKAYLIDATAKTVTEVTYDNVVKLQALVGGYIEVAYAWDNGDVLYVDEEGLLKSKEGRFLILERLDQVLAGNGVMVGREIDEDGNTDPPVMTIDTLRDHVAFDPVFYSETGSDEHGS